jgi:glutamate synthase domain-containing protein 2
MDAPFYLSGRETNEAPRVLIGEHNCAKPYSASLLNISAMSYGSLSKNAIVALNKGAQLGGFYHNTGEGGVSHYHLESGGDLVYQARNRLLRMSGQKTETLIQKNLK